MSKYDNPAEEFWAEYADHPADTPTIEGHEFAGWGKVPSRRGGLKFPKCACGWKGQATNSAASGEQEQSAHAKTARRETEYQRRVANQGGI